MKECLDLTLVRKRRGQNWGFRLIGGRDEGLVLKVDKILGLDTPAAICGLKAGDVLVQVEGRLVTMMTHTEVVSWIKAVLGDSLSLRIQRGDHIIPNISECFPIKSQEQLEEMTEGEVMDYYNMAMAQGLGSRLTQPMFTTCGKLKVKVPKYNNPRDLYGESVMEEMITGTTVDPSKLDPNSEAYKRRSQIKVFDPKTSSVLAVLQDQEIRGNYNVEPAQGTGRKI